MRAKEIHLVPPERLPSGALIGETMRLKGVWENCTGRVRKRYVWYSFLDDFGTPLDPEMSIEIAALLAVS